MAEISVNVTLDCKGLSCPMPIVRTKKAMDQLEAGQVIEVLATDRGSLADMQGWAKIQATSTWEPLRKGKC